MNKYMVMFDEKPMPSFMKVVKVENTILPTISQNVTSIPGRIGSYYFNNEIGTRQIDMEVIIFAERKNEMPKYARQVASWLYHDKPKKLEFSDNRGYYYYASFVGDSSIEELSRIGRATLSFICYDPLLHGEIARTTYPRGGTLNVLNLGTAPTYPTIMMKAATDLTGFNIVSKGEYIGVGKNLGVQDSPKPTDPYAINEDFVSLNAWTQAPSLPGENVSINLQKSAWEIFDGSSVRINDDSWSDNGRGWHGGGLEREIEQAIGDFEFVAPISILAGLPRRRGMIQTNLKDERNRTLLSIKYVDEYIDWQSVRIDVSLFSSSGEENFIYSTHVGVTEDFTGCVRVKRNGNIWNVYVERAIDSNGVHEAQYGKWTGNKGVMQLESTFFVDTKRQYTGRIKKAQIGMLMWEKRIEGKPADKDGEGEILEEGVTPMCIYNLYLRNLTPSLGGDNQQIGFIIYKGDILIIDCESGSIYKNGEYFMNFLSPKSTFIKLNSHNNSIRIDPINGFKDVTIEVTPKWY